MYGDVPVHTEHSCTHVHCTYTVSMKNIRDGDSRRQMRMMGVQYPKEGSYGGQCTCMYCSNIGNNQMLDKVGVIVGLDKSNDDSIRNEEVNGMGQSTNAG